jgi:hypothetical protein
VEQKKKSDQKKVIYVKEERKKNPFPILSEFIMSIFFHYPMDGRQAPASGD